MELILVLILITSCLSVSCGQTTGIDTSFITGNSFVEQTTEEFNRYCPYTKTCVTDLNVEDYSDLHESRSTPCCKQCSCSDTCGLNCCPDKLFSFTNEKDFYDAKELTKCVNAHYNPFFVYIFDSTFYSDLGVFETLLSFEMVSNCPFNYADGRTVNQCRREYREFDFQMPLRNFVPAYDQTKKRVYKNIFCAVCHNADINDLDFAFLTYSCEKRRENLTYLHDLAWNVSRPDGNCDFRFFPNDLRKWYSELCDRNYITRCNVTGRWKMYDRQLEEKCLSYRSNYNGKLPSVYRNVHCFFCNGFSEHDIIRDCKIGPDSVLTSIDFFQNVYSKDYIPFRLFNGDGKRHNMCQHEDIHNVSQVQTWTLECPFGMVLSDYSCLPPSLRREEKSKKGSSVSVYVSLLLEPDHSQLMQHKTSLSAFLSLISTEIQNIFSELVTKDIMVVNYITVSIEPELVKTRINFPSIKEIPIQIKVTLPGIMDAILPILDFSLLFNDVTRMGFFKVRIRRQHPLDDDNIKHHCFLHTILPRNVFYCPYSNSVALDFDTRMRTPSAEIYYMPWAVIIGVEREPFCPRIALKKLAFVENTEPCSDFHKLSRILTDDFLSKQLSENETHIFFCYKGYLQHLKNLKRQDVTHSGREAKELALIYLTIVCLSASVLSLLTTIIIYAHFAVLRTLPGLNIMALSVTLLVYHSLSLVITIAFVDIPWLCKLIGIVTHFFMIQSFCWMFICTFHMMKVFIKIRSKAVPENISRTFIIYIICATLVATTFVVITVIVAEVRSGGQDTGYGGNNCYIKDPVMILCVAAIPVALVVVLNFCMFCVVLFKISKIPSLAASKQKERQNTVIFIKLSTLTGLTSVFGFVFLFTDLYAFGYLFVILNGGQGVFIMISFIFNRRVQNLVQGLYSGGTRTSSSN